MGGSGEREQHITKTKDCKEGEEDGEVDGEEDGVFGAT